MTDLLKELCDKMNEANVRPVFGLRNQGHIQTVEMMLKQGKSWDEIGKVIHWDGETAKKWYGYELGQELNEVD